MSSSDRISPNTLGGVSRIPKGLENLTFLTSCPPVVQPNTRIIALCGITDHRTSNDEPSSDEDSSSTKSGAFTKLVGKGKDLLTAVNSSKMKRRERKEAKMLKAEPDGLASPRNDGWFLSDFYLFYHLFQGLGVCQRWYTCVNPDLLVARYGQFAHGEAASDHRIVLDKNMLADMKAAGNIHTATSKDLLQDFMTYFKAECKTASEQHQSILLMVFGHGDSGSDNHGIAIGGQGTPNTAPRLHIKYLQTLIRGLDISLTLLTTACYAGGWLIQPNLNITGLSAANHANQSWSWHASLGRSYHGSIWATAVTESLIKMEGPKATQLQPGTTSIDFVNLDEDVKSSTFARLADVIATTLETEVNNRSRHHISFAAQDDEWEKEWRDRSGIPLGTFQAQWDKLPRLAPQSNVSQSSGQSAGQTGGLGGGHGFRKSLTRRQGNTLLADLCYRYLNSCPPVPQTASSILPYRAAEHYLRETGPFTCSRAQVQAMLSYRLEATDLATTLKDLTLTQEGQTFPACHNFKWEVWIDAADGGGKGKAFWEIFERLFGVNLLDRPTSKQFYPFPKFYHYLAAAYAENDLGPEAVDAAVATMMAYKQAQVQALTERIRYDRVVRNTARAAFSTLGKRLRSPSPQKRGAIPRFSEEISSF